MGEGGRARCVSTDNAAARRVPVSRKVGLQFYGIYGTPYANRAKTCHTQCDGCVAVSLGADDWDHHVVGSKGHSTDQCTLPDTDGVLHEE